MNKICPLLKVGFDCISERCPFADVVDIPIKTETMSREFSIPETLYLEDNQPRIARHIAYILGVRAVEIINTKKLGYVFYDIQKSVLLSVDFKIIRYTRKTFCSLEGS